MQEHSINKNTIDWQKFRNEAYKKEKKLNTNDEFYSLINELTKKLGDNHSVFLAPNKVKKFYNNDNELPFIESTIISNKIGYIKIPSFVGNERLIKEFVKLLQEKIKFIDKVEIKNWIVDLTECSGGNMWPMYLGISPLLKNSIGGYIVNTKQEFLSWSLSNNSVYEGNEKKLSVENSYKIKSSNPKIAVLISNYTCSSGEIMTLIFKGIPSTILFGENTCGATTGNKTFNLSDGSILALTTSTYADKSKRIYGKQIEPNIYCEKPKEIAIKWLLSNE